MESSKLGYPTCQTLSLFQKTVATRSNQNMREKRYLHLFLNLKDHYRIVLITIIKL